MPAALRIPSSSIPSSSEPSPRSTKADRCWSPRPPARARRSSPSTPWPGRSSEGRKAFYTTPIKALSNQKFADLARRHGADNVGLLTGDNSINGDAPVVVMTTEVLRNMIYAGSPALNGLRFVVLDEVHYLQDAYRGPVWEEVIIHLPAEVRLVCLSATVSNAEEVAEWLATVRGPTTLVLEEQRPVELRNLYLVGDRQSERPHLLPTLIDGRPNTEAERLDNDTLHGRGSRRAPARRPRRRFFTPRRPEVIEMLAEREMLPALYFIFSRMGCEDAVTRLSRRRAAPDHARRACPHPGDRRGADRRRSTDDDLDVLGYDRWEAALEMGLAAHHAGMVPPFKEAVEACFVEGLVKAVFATETLALGVNMPARTVVIERLTKFTGEARAFLTPGEYTQLTGRAGRRGIDDLGYAIVLWSPFVPFDQVASLASSRTYGLRSAFRPTYNMAANLVRRYEPADAHHLLNLSFAQFQADRAVVRFETRIERQQERIARLEREAACDRGDVEEYRQLRQAHGETQAARPSPLGAVEYALSRLHARRRRRGGRAAAGGAVGGLPQGRRGESPRHRCRRRSGDPGRGRRRRAARAPRARGDARALCPQQPGVPAQARRRGAPGAVGAEAQPVGRLRPPRSAPVPAPAALADHPVHDCPDRDRHLRALGQLDRARRELSDMRREVRSRS